MSNGAKIAIGCAAFFIIGFLVIGGTIGFFTYKGFKSVQSLGVEVERTEKLNQQYAFTAPSSSEPATDAKEFEEFMIVRHNLMTTLQENNLVKMMMSADDPAAMEEFGMGDAFGAFGDVGRLMKAVNDSLDENKMSPKEYDYYSERLINLIYQGAKEGDPVLRKLWSDMEDAAQITGSDKTNWTTEGQNNNNPNNFTWGLAEQLGVDKTEEIDVEGLKALGPHRQKLSEQATLLFFENTIMSINNAGTGNYGGSTWQETDQFDNSNSNEDFQQLMDGMEQQPSQ